MDVAPARSPARQPLLALADLQSAHDIALAHLRVSRSGPWQSTELAHPKVSKCRVNYAI